MNSAQMVFGLLRFSYYINIGYKELVCYTFINYIF